MSTIALNKNGYVEKEESRSLGERIKRYFETKGAEIAGAMLFMNGITNAYTLYRNMAK